jgi:drug/metabolite transporter (DMT)-like permease
MTVSPALAFIFSLAAGCAFAVLGLAYRAATHHACRSLPFTAAFLFSAGVLLLGKSLGEHAAWGDWRFWAIGVTMGLNFFGAVMIFMRANTLGPSSINWTFTNLGLLLPILLAPLLFHEPLLPVDFVVCLLFVGMLIALAIGMRSGDETKPEHLVLYAVFLLLLLSTNGLSLILSKVKYQVFADGSTAALAAIFYLSGAAVALATMTVRERRLAITPVEWRFGLFAGLCSGTGIWLTLASMRLPVAVAFPVNQGTSMLGGILLTALIYRERFNPAKVIGLLLGIVTLLLAGLREPAMAVLGQWLP